MEREDAIIVATVSAIYGLGDPQSYFDDLHLRAARSSTSAICCAASRSCSTPATTSISVAPPTACVAM